MTNFLLLKTDVSFTAKQVVQILHPAFSPVGSNRRVHEEMIMSKLVEFVGLCEGTVV